MEQLDWKESIYSDGSKHYISNPNPGLGETVTISLRAFTHAPVKAIFLRCVCNGAEICTHMPEAEKTGVFTYYKCELKISQADINYHFIIRTERELYYYNQLEVTDYPPSEEYDFRILAGFDDPEWIREAVFYQIFPDRFCNGNPDNDVQGGEYMFDGHPAIRKSWGAKVGEYRETFCLDFFGGDLEGIKQKIPHLKELGVNALYLNPIFYAATNHKYDCLDYFKVDPHFGGDKALRELSEELHKNGMRIILDLSINHTGTAHKWFNRDGEFFPKQFGAFGNPDAKEREYYYFEPDGSYHGWAGVDTLPTLNYTSAELRDIIYRSEDSVVRRWLKEPYSIDGWRFDVGFCTARKDEAQLQHEVWPEIRKSVKGINPAAYIMGEHWTDNREFLGGNEWDASMNYFGFGRPVRGFAGEADELVKRLGEYAPPPSGMRAEGVAAMFMQHLARLPWQLASLQYNLYDSHDISRLHNNSGITYESRRAAIIMQFTFPGAPGIYYGDEISLDGHTLTVEGCRYPMEWDAAVQDGACLELHKTLARLKREEDALQTGGFKILYAKAYVLSYARFTSQKAFITVCSQDTEPVRALIPAALVGVADDWTITEIFGRTPSLTPANGILDIKLNPHESLLLQAATAGDGS